MTFFRLLILVFCVLSGSAFAQRYSFLTYNTEQGLPQSQVTSITQDDFGYLWVGTLGGLSKFNGKDFTSYSTEDGLLNNRITFLTFIDGELWIGHEGGVSRMGNKSIQRWSFGNENKTVKVSKIIRYKGRILIASNGAGIYEVKSGNLIKIPLKNEEYLRVRDLMVVDDALYIGCGDGVLITRDLKSFKPISAVKGYSISGLAISGQSIYITAFLDGLLSYSLKTNQLERVSGIDSTGSLRGCMFDSKNDLWVISTTGVVRLHQGKVDLQLNGKNGLPMESIRTAFEDEDGNYWFGSEGKGLFRFPGEKFVHYNESTGLISDLILNVNQDHLGAMWIGTYDKGLMRMDRTGKIETIPLEASTIWTSLMNIDGFNWFGTGSGLIALDSKGKSKIYLEEDGIPGNKVTTLMKVTSRSFYIGGSDGISFYSKGTFKKLNSGNIETVRDFCRVGNEVYCATDKGFFHIEGNNVVRVKGFDKTIYCLVRDAQNRVWIGTEEGLFIYDGISIRQVTVSKVPSSNFINFINFYEDKLFVGTNNGLYILDNIYGKRSSIKVMNFGIGEGVVNLETNLNSSFIDSKGSLWFGTASGLVRSKSRISEIDFSPPKIVLKNILSNYQSFDFLKYAKKLDKNGFPLEMNLPYTKNTITFEIDGISLANYPGLKFQFLLEGLDEQWSPMNANTTMTYNGLAAGDYVLHARSIDSRGKISEEIKFAFTIRQAFYKTWWFIGLLVLTVALIVLRIVQFRLKREREKNEKEKLEFKSRLLTLEQKSLNASMNRHFIFNSLNSIQYFINTQDRLSANKFLTNFAKLIRKNLDSSDDGNMVPLSQELERLELYMSLECMRFKDRFEYSIDVQEDLDTESVIIPAMMLQPFIENSIIHGILPDESKKGLITLSITLNGDMLTIDIQDNGVGIEKSISEKSNYSGDHRSQGMEITSKRIELLRKLSKKKIELIGPVQVLNNDRSIKGTRVTLKIQVENLEN